MCNISAEVILILVCASYALTKPAGDNTNSTETSTTGENPVIIIDPTNHKVEEIATENTEATTIATTTSTIAGLPKVELDGLVLRSRRSILQNYFSQNEDLSVEGLKHIEFDDTDSGSSNSDLAGIVFQDDLGNQHKINAYIPLNPDGLVPISELVNNEDSSKKYVAFVPFFKVRKYHLEKRHFKDCC